MIKDKEDFIADFEKATKWLKKKYGVELSVNDISEGTMEIALNEVEGFVPKVSKSRAAFEEVCEKFGFKKSDYFSNIKIAGVGVCRFFKFEEIEGKTMAVAINRKTKQYYAVSLEDMKSEMYA